jgi:AP2-associated kinase
MQKFTANLSKALNNAKEVTSGVLNNAKDLTSGVISNAKNSIQTNVNKIASNMQGKPTLGGNVQLKGRELEEIKLISQGGYAYVFQVRDVATGELFALKKMICQNNERLKTARNEINILKSLPNHGNILRLYESDIVKVSDGHHVYILLELCEEGSLFDLMMKHETTKLNEKQIIFIMREVCEGVKALHTCEPPIVHRDLKIENVLLHNKKFKLCDFGSCSSRTVDFSQVSPKEFAFYEEEYDKNTTLMYRPPEMCDPYQKYIVNDRVDIWMIGCMLFTLCFYKQPFQEASKLSIVNGAYTFPKDHNYPEKLVDIIRMMLTPNPIDRPSIDELCHIFNDYFNIESITLNEVAQRIKDEALNKDNHMQGFHQAKASSHEGDIPVEELMKIQKKLQNQQKKKSKEPQFVEWDKAQYPGQTKSPNKGNEEFGDFVGGDFKFPEGQQDQGTSQNNNFDAFGFFDSNDGVPAAAKQDDQSWGAFEFGGTTTAATEQTSNANAGWTGDLWDAPQFDAKKEADKPQAASNATADNFDFFGDFTSGNDQKN